jgi:flavin reductase (DIM6/NTAB) family NADH-FMN oxidoreductase RutF
MKRVEYSVANAATKHPAKVVVAIVKDKDGKFNPITLEWYMKTSIKPPMYAISIGHTRYSHECLQKNRFFNLCFPSKQMIEAVKLWGSKSGKDMDKLIIAGHEWFTGRLAKYPIIKDAKATFECEVVTQVKSGDHTIFVGEVKHSWVDDDKEVITVRDLM